MAVIQYTAIVNQIRGKLNGSVFNKSRNAYTLQRKQQGARKSTQLQLTRRSAFSSIQREWKTLSIAQRSDAQLSAAANPTTDRFGNEVVLSGYNHWVKANLIRLLSGQTMHRGLAVTPAAGYQYNLISSVTSITNDPNGRVIIETGISAVATVSNSQALVIVAYLSYPMSQGVTAYSGRWFYVGSLIQGAATLPTGGYDLDFLPSDPIDYPSSVEDQKVLLRIDMWQTQRGALINRQIVETQLV